MLADEILRVASVIACVAASEDQKFACSKVVLSFSEELSEFFGIFNGENTLFTKNGLVTEKNYFTFLHF